MRRFTFSETILENRQNVIIIEIVHNTIVNDFFKNLCKNRSLGYWPPVSRVR